MNKQLFILTLFVATIATLQLNAAEGARSDSPPPISELTYTERGRLSSPPMSDVTNTSLNSLPMTDSDDDFPARPLRPAIPPAFSCGKDLSPRARSN